LHWRGKGEQDLGCLLLLHRDDEKTQVFGAMALLRSPYASKGGVFGCRSVHSRHIVERLDRIAQGVPCLAQSVLHGNDLPEL